MNNRKRFFLSLLAFLLTLSVMSEPILAFAESEEYSYGTYEEGIYSPAYSAHRTVPALKNIDNLMNGDFEQGYKYWIGYNGKWPAETSAIKQEDGNTYLSFDGTADGRYDGVVSPVFSLKDIPVGTVLGILYKWRGREGFQVSMLQWAMGQDNNFTTNTRLTLGNEHIYIAESDEDWNISVLYMLDGVAPLEQGDKTLNFVVELRIMEDPSLKVDFDDVQIIRKTGRKIHALDFTLLYDLDNLNFPVKEEAHPDYSAFHFDAEKLPIPGPSGIQVIPKKADNAIVQGFPDPVGDAFALPTFEAALGAPIISQVTPQAGPNDAIMLAGEGFTSDGLKAYVYTQSDEDNGRSVEVSYTVLDDTKMTFAIGKDLEYGIYGVYLENALGKSNVKLLNAPQIWYLGQEHLAKGEDLNIYGENLTTDNQTYLRLSGGGRGVLQTDLHLLRPL